MNTANELLYKRAEEAVWELHRDRTVSIETALDNLRGIRDECSAAIDALEQDLRAELKAADGEDAP